MTPKAQQIYALLEQGMQVSEVAEKMNMPISKVSEARKLWRNVHDYLSRPDVPLSALDGMGEFSRV